MVSLTQPYAHEKRERQLDANCKQVEERAAITERRRREEKEKATSVR